MPNKLKTFWRNVKHNSLQNLRQNLLQLSGEDAYERYLVRLAAHQKTHAHKEDALPLSRKAFFKQWQDGKWTGTKRCC